jgi:hypothetical protein
MGGLWQEGATEICFFALPQTAVSGKMGNMFRPIADGNPMLVNADVYYGAAPGTLLMDSIVPKFDGQAWKVSYNIKEREEGWETYLLDTGYYSKGVNGKLESITEDDGTPISEPAKLDGSGVKLSDQSQPGVNVGPFHKYHQQLFSLLALPNPFAIHTIRNG